MQYYKICIISLMFLFFSATQMMAQFHLSVGPNMGMNYNIGAGSDINETPTGLGFNIGVTTDMQFTHTIGLIANLQFYDSRSGGSSTEGTVQGVPYTVNDDASLAYFLIEPLLKLTIPNSGFHFLAGPSIGFNVQGSREVRITSQNNQITFQDGSTKFKQSLKNTLVRFALKAGAGYDINVGAVVLSPVIAFDYGITNVQSDVSSRVLSIQSFIMVKFKLI